MKSKKQKEIALLTGLILIFTLYVYAQFVHKESFQTNIINGTSQTEKLNDLELIKNPISENQISKEWINKLKNDSTIKRYYFSKLNFLPQPSATEMKLQLFNNEKINIEIQKMEKRSGGRYSLFGKIKNEEMSQTVLLVNPIQKTVFGYIFSKGKNYNIMPFENAVHSVSEIDMTKTSHANPEKPTLPQSIKEMMKRFRDELMTPKIDDGTVIDLLVVYTQDVDALTDDIESHIELAVDTANIMLRESGVNTQLRLVHSQEIEYVETGDSTKDLYNIALGKQGLDVVHQLRDQYGADVVSFWVQKSDVGGKASNMFIIGSWFAPFAYNVIHFGGTGPNYGGVLVHEFGHNMGSNHDWLEDDTKQDVWAGFPTPYAYGMAYDYGNGKSLSTMMVQTGISGTSVENVPYFSNPNKMYNGTPLGIPDHKFQPTDASFTKPADDVRLFNETAPTVANFRKSVSVEKIGDISINRWLVNDNGQGESRGNGNFTPETGERIELRLAIKNAGITNLRSISASLSTQDENLTIIGDAVAHSFEYKNGIFINDTDPYIIEISPSTPSHASLSLSLNVFADLAHESDRDIQKELMLTEGDIIYYPFNRDPENQLMSQENPNIYGKWIVWEDYRNKNSDIYAYDLSIDSDNDGIPNYLELVKPNPDLAEIQITSDPLNQIEPQIYGDIILWKDMRNGSEIDKSGDIYFKDMTLEKEFRLTSTGYYSSIDLSQNKVTWINNSKVYVYFLDLDKDGIFDYKINPELPREEAIKQISQEGTSLYADSDEERLVWSEKRNTSYEIYLYDFNLEKEFTISADSKSELSPTVLSDKIGWVHDNKYIYLYNLALDSDNDGIPNYQDENRTPENDPAQYKLNYNAYSYPSFLAFSNKALFWLSIANDVDGESQYDLSMYDLMLDSDKNGIPNYMEPIETRQNDAAIIRLTATPYSESDYKVDTEETIIYSHSQELIDTFTGNINDLFIGKVIRE